MTTMESMENMMRKLNLVEKSAISLKPVEEEYILQIDVQQSSEPTISGSDDRLLACSSSNYNIRMYSRYNMATLQQIAAHENVVSGIKFAHNEKDLLFSSSWDKTIRCWDIRTDVKKPVQEFLGSNKSLLCLDINSSDTKLAAGTEATKNNEVDIKIWDRRKSSVLTEFVDSHQDDITRVSFHPTSENFLASGSTDGLVCTFDLAEDTEDNSLLLTLNSLSSVAFVGWCAPAYNQVYCTTHIDTFHVWDSIEGDLVFQMTDLKKKLDIKIDYIVDYIGNEESNQWLVLVGTKGGDMSIVQFSDKKDVETICSLTGGHRGIVRCLNWDVPSRSLVTGGEDSMLCLWSTVPASGKTDIKGVNKLKMKQNVSKKNAPY